MATLDDKLLGEKLHYYCSSSEDEDEPVLHRGEPAPPQHLLDPETSNTGPKGVIKDWQRFKQLETEKREEADMERIALAKKLSMACKTSREEDEEKERERRLEEELEEVLNDDFMQEYMQKRMEEMMNSNKSSKRFGELIELFNGEEFLNAIDNEEKVCTVIVLIHEPGVTGCQPMVHCLECLAKEYPTVKFCQIVGSAAGLSKHFKVSGVPAFLVYRAGQLLNSFVRLTDQLGEDFYSTDVESFLMEHALLPNKDDIPKIIRGPCVRKDEDNDSS